MNKLKKLLLISSALLLSTASNTFATSPTTGTITVSGSVTGTCSVSASTMAFGAINTGGTTFTTSTVTPNCSPGTAYTVTNAGNNNYLYRTGASSPQPGDADTIEFIIKLTGGSTAFTLASASTIKLEGIGTGVALANDTTLTGTANSSTGKTAGLYTGSVTLNIAY